ncbi:transcriptional regulator, AraC family [Roseibium hamelinense]|uniref:Transcriptional regulator, AraC family n=1 Tax=Roseibium hamelinense TaxID=150831 RepID=A0A562TB13_9HYPH|nr:AraC family transcriptional regulator [Roseibium hamelinense]MTI45175.1 AraC family transcriptional regulator [Roseibium hamelinense]TWI90464.1 transcriptional regulator, AraC family [Roseibium hamelinense]
MDSILRTSFSGRLDRLSSLIERFRVHAVLGPIDGNVQGAISSNFFVLAMPDESLKLVFLPHGGAVQEVDGISVPNAMATTLVAADIQISGAGNHLVCALPERIEISLRDAPDLANVVAPLVEEVVRPRCGGQAVFHRLCEVVVIRLLRHALETGAADVGLLAGLAHPRLAAALVAMHEAPDRTWTLEQLASVAGMSRTQFAVTFKDVVGVTPGGYLSGWRLDVARIELENGAPVKVVAKMCGFSSAASFSRAFTRQYGHAPTQERRVSA